jgi:hypothetical protein
MFILTCNGKETHIADRNQVGYAARDLAEEVKEDVYVDQFEMWLGDTEPMHHIVNVVHPTNPNYNNQQE